MNSPKLNSSIVMSWNPCKIKHPPSLCHFFNRGWKITQPRPNFEPF